MALRILMAWDGGQQRRWIQGIRPYRGATGNQHGFLRGSGQPHWSGRAHQHGRRWRGRLGPRNTEDRSRKPAREQMIAPLDLGIGDLCQQRVSDSVWSAYSMRGFRGWDFLLE